MRSALVLLTLSALSQTALAGEPGTCESLLEAEARTEEARSELADLRETAYGAYYRDQMAHVEADERRRVIIQLDRQVCQVTGKECRAGSALGIDHGRNLPFGLRFLRTGESGRRWMDPIRFSDLSRRRDAPRDESQSE